MSSLAKKIKNAPDLDTLMHWVAELQILANLASQRVTELEAEELDRRLCEEMWPGLKDLG
jgi:hypothetical protein